MNRAVLSAIAAFFLLNNLSNSALAGPVPVGQMPAKIEELEAAGQLITQGKIDEAFKKIEEAVKKHPILPPPRLILARFMIAVKYPQWRIYLEQAATDSPDHPDVYLTLGEVAFDE